MHLDIIVCCVCCSCRPSHLRFHHQVWPANPGKAEKPVSSGRWGIFRRLRGLLSRQDSSNSIGTSVLWSLRDYSSRNFSRGFGRYLRLRDRNRYRRYFCKSHELGDGALLVFYSRINGVARKTSVSPTPPEKFIDAVIANGMIFSITSKKKKESWFHFMIERNRVGKKCKTLRVIVNLNDLLSLFKKR